MILQVELVMLRAGEGLVGELLYELFGLLFC